jgi:fused signal recognition particle receptor
MTLNFIILIVLIALVTLVVLLFLIKILTKGKVKEKGNDFYSKSRAQRENLGYKLRSLFSGKVINQAILEDLEETLIKADIGPKLSSDLIYKLTKNSPKNIDEAIKFLKFEIKDYLIEKELVINKGKLNILLILGVNGVGKTTSIAKIANNYLKKGYKVMLAAGDTFRAAAIDQLSKWAHKLNIPMIKQQENSDPASVVYDAVDSAKAKGIDLLIVDTAGRLHTKVNLMEELKKIESVISRKENVIKKNILVIDATTGQNAFQQAKSFNEAINVDGILIAKYDSQSKGGIIINIQKNLNIPFYFIGIGEKLDDLLEFNKEEYIENIFS